MNQLLNKQINKSNELLFEINDDINQLKLQKNNKQEVILQQKKVNNKLKKQEGKRKIYKGKKIDQKIKIFNRIKQRKKIKTSMITKNQKPQNTSQLNIKKLKYQNIQLHKQIHQLQQQVNIVLTRQQTKRLKNIQLQKQLTSIYGQQLQDQQKEIKKLKQKIYYLKSTNAKLNLQYLNKQQDQLIVFEKERDHLIREKQLLKGKVKDKQDVLNKNNGLDQHKHNLQNQYNQTKKSNIKTSALIVQIQRQIRKYHYIAQTIKSHKKQQPNQATLNNHNYQLQFQQTAHQISKLLRQIKQIQDKWKPSIDSLDNQYFTLSSSNKQLHTKFTKLQKQFKIYQHRSKSLRDQSQIIQDRNRLAKITTNSSMGFSQSFIKKQSLKQSNQLLLSSQRKQKIKSDYILKQLQNIKAKKNIQQLFPTDKTLFNKNRTFQIPKNQPKQQKSNKINRSNTHIQIISKQKQPKIIKQRQSLTIKQSSQKIIPESPKSKKNKQLVKNQNQKSMKNVVQTKLVVQKQLKGKKQKQIKQSQNKPLKQQNKRIDSPKKQQKIKQQNKKQKRQRSISPSSPSLKTKQKSIKQKDKQSINKNKEDKKIQIRNNSTKIQSQIKKQKSTKSIIQSSQDKQMKKIQMIKQNKPFKQSNKKSQSIFISNENKQTKLKDKPIPKYNKQEQIIKKKSTQKLQTNKINELKQQQKTDKMKKQIKQVKQKTKQKQIKLVKRQKQLKQQIKIIQNKKLQQKQSKTINKNVKTNQQQRITQNQQQTNKFQIRLSNKKKSTQNINQSINQQKLNINSQIKSIPQLPKQQTKQYQINNIKPIQNTNQSSFIIKQQAQQQFKPYLIKRKRPGGSLNFNSNNNQFNKQKSNLLQLIQKQSIGVGHQKNH